MRRGYWTGFIMGGMLGMLAARAYGDRLLDAVMPGMIPKGSSGSMDDDDEVEFSYKPAPRRQRRYRRTF